MTEPQTLQQAIAEAGDAYVAQAVATALDPVNSQLQAALNNYAASQAALATASADLSTSQAALLQAQNSLATDDTAVATAKSEITALTAQVQQLTSQVATLTSQIVQSGWQPPTGPSAAHYVDSETPWKPGISDPKIAALPMTYYSHYVQGDETIDLTYARAMIAKPNTLFIIDVPSVNLPADFNQPDSAMWQGSTGVSQGASYLKTLGWMGATLPDGSLPVLNMPANSTTKNSATSGTNPWRAAKFSDGANHSNPRALICFGNVTLNLTGQNASDGPGGLMFHGFTVFDADADMVYIGDITVIGWSGRGGGPPQENFAVEVDVMVGRATPTKVRYNRIRAIGARADGITYGTVGFTVQDGTDCIVWDSTVSHHMASAAVSYRSNIRYYRCVFGDPVTDGKQPAGLGGNSLYTNYTGGPSNIEADKGGPVTNYYFDCVWNLHAADGNAGVHITFSPIVGGHTEVWNPTWSQDGAITNVVNGVTLHPFVIQTWVDGSYAACAALVKSGAISLKVYDHAGNAFTNWRWQAGSTVVASG